MRLLEEIKEFEATINDLNSYEDIKIDEEVEYYCACMAGTEIRSRYFSSNGSTLYGARVLPTDCGYILKEGEAVVVGPAGEVVLITQDLLCDLYKRAEGTLLEKGNLKKEYGWFKIKFKGGSIVQLNAKKIPRGYVLNYDNLQTDGSMYKKAHGENDYIICANGDIRKRYIVNGVIYGLEVKGKNEGRKRVVKSIEQAEYEIEV